MHAPIMRFRIACASLMVFSWKQCSSPGTPCVLDVEPTAMTSLSYGSSNLSALPATAVAGSFPSGSGLELEDDDGEVDEELALEPLALVLVLPLPGNLTGAVAGVYERVIAEESGRRA